MAAGNTAVRPHFVIPPNSVRRDFVVPADPVTFFTPGPQRLLRDRGIVVLGCDTSCERGAEVVKPAGVMGTPAGILVSDHPFGVREVATDLGTVDVFRTFAEGQQRSRRWAKRARGTRMAPTGRIHAAQQKAVVTLCGLRTRDLFEFGPSRYPFERTPAESRCRSCNELAGRPTE